MHCIHPHTQQHQQLPDSNIATGWMPTRACHKLYGLGFTCNVEEKAAGSPQDWTMLYIVMQSPKNQSESTRKGIVEVAVREMER
jgi:hypothetical protein